MYNPVTTRAGGIANPQDLSDALPPFAKPARLDGVPRYMLLHFSASVGTSTLNAQDAELATWLRQVANTEH